MNSNFYLEDILSQDTEIRKVLAYCRTKETGEKFGLLKKMRPGRVVFSGMGSSNFCSYGAAVLLNRNGIAAEVVSTGELLYYERGSLGKETVLCLISQSGESAEIKHLIGLLEKDVFVIAITNQADSTLAKRGDITFLMNVSDEISVTTRTYQSSLILTQMVAAELCGKDEELVLEEYEDAAGKMTEYLGHYKEEMERIREFCRGMQTVSLAGRGNSLSSVRAGALFLREVGKFPALDFDCAEFRHGPIEMVQDGFYCIIFAPGGATQELSVKLAVDVAKKDGKAVVITDEDGMRMLPEGEENILVMTLPKTEEYSSQILHIIPVQLLANAIAEGKKIPVGVFRWGSKVTATE